MFVKYANCELSKTLLLLVKLFCKKRDFFQFSKKNLKTKRIFYQHSLPCSLVTYTIHREKYHTPPPLKLCKESSRPPQPPPQLREECEVMTFTLTHLSLVRSFLLMIIFVNNDAIYATKYHVTTTSKMIIITAFILPTTWTNDEG